MKIRILSRAERDLEEAVDYFNEQRAGLGYEFAAEARRTFERIAFAPKAWPRFSERSRRCLTNRFPYGVLYRLCDDEVLVVAVMHLRRDPHRWQGRDQ